MPIPNDPDSDPYREDMINRLHNDKAWMHVDTDINLTIVCPICAAIILLNSKQSHITWHEVNNA